MGKKFLDRRVHRTRPALQEALVALILEKGYEAVTVQDVIDRANVGRSTFYAHFRDKEELLLSEFERLWSQFEQHLGGRVLSDEYPWRLSSVMFQHAQSYHPVYKAVVGKRSGQMMQAHLHKYLTALVRQHLKSHWSGKKKEAVPPEVLTHYLVSSLLALLTWWLDHDLPYSAERMDRIYLQLTKPGIESILLQGSSSNG
jgi:AcrR family transcriptional regulator